MKSFVTYKLLSVSGIAKKYSEPGQLFGIMKSYVNDGVYNVMHTIGEGSFDDLTHKQHDKFLEKAKVLMQKLIKKYNLALHNELVDKAYCNGHYADAKDDIEKYECGDHKRILLHILDAVRPHMTRNYWTLWDINGISYETDVKEYISVSSRASIWSYIAKNVKVTLYGDVKTFDIPEFTYKSEANRI